MKSDPGNQFGIDKQIDYAKLSGKDLVKGANPALQPFVASMDKDLQVLFMISGSSSYQQIF